MRGTLKCPVCGDGIVIMITSRNRVELLHMIISEITINELREIDSIKLKINNKF